MPTPYANRHQPPSTHAIMTLEEMQQTVDRWVSQWEEGYWEPLANLARLTEEVGELSRELNDQYGPKTKKPSESKGEIAEELGDVLFVVACIANSLDIDLEKAFRDVMEKYDLRDADRWTPGD